MVDGNNELQLGRYKHYKGNEYNVLMVAMHSETLEKFVVYEALYENKVSKLWVRPLKMFVEKVEKDGKLIDRFEYIGNWSNNKTCKLYLICWNVFAFHNSSAVEQLAVNQLVVGSIPTCGAFFLNNLL